jgi:hypothetical protein
MSSTDPSWAGQPRADAGRLWAGGAATALVAAGIALVGVLVLRKLVHVSVLSPDGTAATASDSMTMLPIAAALASVIATALLHLLMATTPRAPQFFAWIASLAMALIVLQVFVTGTSLIAEVETSAFYLVIGVAITSLLFGVGRTAVRYQRSQHYRDPYRDAYPDETANQYGPRRYR